MNATTGIQLTDVAAEDVYGASWMLWESSSSSALPLPRSIDHALAGYVFYPEAEWKKFGYRPPEIFPLLGAWRDQNGGVFAFLMDATEHNSSYSTKKLLLYAAGNRDAVEKVGSTVTALKTSLANSERKELQILHAGERLEREKKSPAVSRLLKLISIFTVVVNAFSLYLRKLPTPEFPAPWVSNAYQILILVVHFAALFLLLMVTLVGIGYVLRYGLLVLRRL